MGRWTISDIAREANVSKTTVSRVLNGRPDVDADTSARILSLVEEMGYVRSARAVELASGAANAVGLLAPIDTSPWMIQVLRGVMEQVQRTHLSLTLHAQPADEAEVGRLRTAVRGGRMDALIVVSLQRPLPFLAEAAAGGLPVVMLNDHGFNDGLPDVVPDEATGIGAAVDHLVAVGRRRFAILAGPADNPVSLPRLGAYRDALARHGVALDPRLVAPSPFAEPAAREAVARLVATGLPFDALLASSDAMAVGAVRALKGAGRAVPRDVSVVGFDDFEAAEFTEPRLTTVHNPLLEMGSRAAARLVAALAEGRPLAPGQEVVRTHLIVRDSSDPGPRVAGGPAP